MKPFSSVPEKNLSAKAIHVFADHILSQGALHYRDLPWRNRDDPYQVLVSEVMLQQTQVARVLKYWDRFMTLFPTLDALASAETSLVLEQWQGLGYNRRALALKKTAEVCARENEGLLPVTYDGLLELPGIGKATAAGVMVFAHNEPAVYVETNVRTVFIHEFFGDKDAVHDKVLEPLVEKTCPKTNPRRWYYALLDYGAHLKQTVGNVSQKSAHYAKQSTFVGSKRQKRAELLRCVLAEPGISVNDVRTKLDDFERQAGRNPVEQAEFEAILAGMVSEGFFCRDGDMLFA